MAIRLTEAKDWMFLKQVRLAALLDTPTAFGVSYQTAAQYSDEQWKERASSAAGAEFWLAIKDDKPVGMIGAGVSQANRYNGRGRNGSHLPPPAQIRTCGITAYGSCLGF